MEERAPNPTPEEIVKNRRSIKRHIPVQGFFHYLSSDLLGIRQFARNNGIIKFSFFIFMRLDSQLPERFIQQIQRSLAEPLHKALYPVVESGWRFFQKLEYNKLIYLYQFSRDIAGLEPGTFSQSPGKILDHMRHIETAYYIFYSDPSLLASLERQLEIYAKLGNVQKFPVDGIIRAIQMLLSRNSQRLTLYSLFVSLNSMHHKRFCDLEDTITQETRSYFDPDHFDIDEHLRPLLENYTSEVILSVKNQMKNHNETALYKGLLPPGGKTGTHNLNLLKQFYNGNSGNEDRFTPEFENLHSFLVVFSQKVLIEFRGILMSEVTVTGKKKVRIFDTAVFSNYFKRIAYIKDKLDKAMLKVPQFPRMRYLRVLSEGSMAVTTNEEPIFSSVSELLSLYFQMSRTLARVLAHASAAKNEAGVPVIRPIAYEDMQFFIPFESSLQYSSAFLAGQTVRDALRTVAKVLLQLCLELRESELITIINKDIHTMETLKNLIKELKRVSSPSRYMELREELGIRELEPELNSGN